MQEGGLGGKDRIGRVGYVEGRVDLRLGVLIVRERRLGGKKIILVWVAGMEDRETAKKGWEAGRQGGKVWRLIRGLRGRKRRLEIRERRLRNRVRRQGERYGREGEDKQDGSVRREESLWSWEGL
jgi:hypothetical protein